MRLAVLLAAGLLLASAPLAFAAERCAPASADRFVPLEGLPGLPEGWVPLLALDESRLPPVPSVAASGPGGVCDLTGGLAAFARVAGMGAPAQLATLAVAASFPDQLGVPEVRSLVVQGQVALVETWSARDGVVADWVVDLASLRADFVVRAVGVGAYLVPDEGFEGWHVWPGFSSQLLHDLEAGLLVTKVRMAPNPDGSQFRLTYFTQFYASEAEADAYAAAYAKASQDVWVIENQQWGFTSGDTDRIYDIRMDGCSCISGGFNVNIRVHAKLEDLIRLLNLEYPTYQHFYRIVIGHEWHHHLQYTINQWKIGNVLTEGGARFSETVFEPEGAHGPKTIQTLPNANGFSNVMLKPNTALSGRTYDFGLFWGYLYSADGGIDVLREVYRESNNVQGNADFGLPDAVTRALGNVGGAVHDTFDEAYADFAVQMYKRSFVWGKHDGSEPRDWGLYLPDVAQVAFTSQAQGAVQAWDSAVNFRGILFGSVAGKDPLLTHYAGDGALGARWVWTTPGAVMARPAGTAYLIQDGPVEDVSLVLIRGPTVPNDPMARVLGSGKFRAVVEAPTAVLPGLPG